MKTLASAGMCVWAVMAVIAADTPYMKGKRFAAGDYTGGRVCIVEADGKISWEQKAPSCDDLWILPGGSILFNTGHGVKEVAMDGKVLFEYQSVSEIYAVQRLANGNTFVGECSSGRLLELAPDGKTVKSLSLLPEGQKGGHSFMRNARVLKNGNYLVTLCGQKTVAEYAPDGKEAWTFKVPGGVPHSVQRLANGNTLIACGDRGEPGLLEVSPGGEIVWKVDNSDLPGRPLKFLTGFQKLPNGNVLISNWLGHGKFGTAPHLLEITPEKKVVWTYADHRAFKTIAAVGVFAEGGEPLCGEERFAVLARTPMTDTHVYPQGTVKLRYRSAFDGKEDWALFTPGDTNRNTVVYLHGSFSSGDQIFTRKDVRAFWLTRILKGRHPLLSINMRGTSYMSPAATRDLTDLLDACRGTYGLGRVVLLGGSGGASSAMAYACVHPERVDGVIAMGMCDIVARLDFARKSSLPVLQKLAATVFAAYGGTPEELPEVYRQRSVLAQADRLTMPIILTMGEKDALIPVAETRKIAAALKRHPAFRYVEIPGGNHDSAVWVDVDLEAVRVREPETRAR
ncbi:MAG: alpha/beta fold hydrolase [Kiritimatiellia bacterium]|jgi:pimeloyl-ACP methyl ester carboxylesterase/outer membrane protein assembly factor BamB|nr:alpha/beta fold hydrolase [Kiritimatiellia bacterium]